jgi:hypothetical protein
MPNWGFGHVCHCRLPTHLQYSLGLPTPVCIDGDVIATPGNAAAGCLKWRGGRRPCQTAVCPQSLAIRMQFGR